MNTRLLHSFLVLAWSVALQSLGAQSLIRGPYLQMLSPNAVTIRWQTDVACDSRVNYGAAPAALANPVSDAASLIEHDIRLNGLTPDTTYYYAVGTSTTTLAGGDATFRFKTPPLPGTIKPVRIWVLGDSGTSGDGTGRAENVRDAYYNSPLYQDPDLWLMLGDNAYDNGTEAQTTRAIFNSYPTMLRKAALFPTIGNHDTDTSNGAPYFNAFTLPTNGECGGLASNTERYYSFDYANIHFVCLDDRLRAVGGPQLTWLENDLANTTQKWIIAFWHAPPYSKGSHNSDSENALVELRANFLPILENHGVDLVLCGHSHSYERSMLINGHYGLSGTFIPATHALDTGNGKETGDGAYHKAEGSNNGTVYVAAGNSGKISGGALNHPVMITSQNKLGSLILDVNGNRLDLREIGTDGLVFDNFTLLKEPLGSQLTPLAWPSLCDHAGTPRILPIPDNNFIEPRQAGLRPRVITGLAGDTTGNGRCTGRDVSKIGVTTGPFDPLQADYLRADINGDGSIDTTDRDAAWADRAKRTDTVSQP